MRPPEGGRAGWDVNELNDVNQGRIGFIRNHFHHDVAAPEHLSLEIVVFEDLAVSRHGP